MIIPEIPCCHYGWSPLGRGLHFLSHSWGSQCGRQPWGPQGRLQEWSTVHQEVHGEDQGTLIFARIDDIQRLIVMTILIRRIRRTFRSFCFCLHCFILWLMKTTPSRNFFYKNCYVPSRKNVQQKYFFEVCVKLIFYSAWPNIKILNCLAANGSLFYHCILFTRKLFFAHLTSFKHSDNRDTKTIK